MGCTASVSSQSSHGNKVVPDDGNGAARRNSTRTFAESPAETAGKVSPSAGSHAKLGDSKSDKIGVPPRPRLSLIRFIGSRGGGEGGTREKQSTGDCDVASVKALDVSRQGKDSRAVSSSTRDTDSSDASPQPLDPNAAASERARGAASCSSSSSHSSSSGVCADDTEAEKGTQHSREAPTVLSRAASQTLPERSATATVAEAAAGTAAGGLPDSSSIEAAAGERAASEPVPPLELRAVTRLGITLRGLRRLYDMLCERYGTQRLWSMSTEELARVWVVEATGPRRCRLLEVEGLLEPSDVAPPTYFISHTWQNRAGLLFESVLGHYLLAVAPGAETGSTDADGTAAACGGGAAPPSVAVWIDLLAVNQHEGTAERQLDLAAVEDVVRACGGGTIAVTDLAAGVNPASRAWCLYEWGVTLAAHGPDGLHAQLDPYERASVIGGLDIRHASCKYDTDKAMILGAVAASHGSAEAFNTALRLQMLLQPLSYREDLRLRRLPPPVAPTSPRLPHPPLSRWDFSPVRRWLDAGASGPRVLCVLGGSGEGKSTLCAALCNPCTGLLRGGGGGGGLVAAHHFVRFADRRRQEPLRIVRSLAYQLAEGLPLMANYVLQLDAAEVAQLSPDGCTAFEELLLKPLSAGLMGAGGQVVILVDGLDEADPPTLTAPMPHTTPTPLLPPSPRRLPAPLPGTDATAALLLSASAPTRANLLPPTSPSAAAAAAPAAAALPVCGNKVVQLLAKQLRTLPCFVRFVVSTDPGAMGGHVRAALDRAFADCGGVTYMTPQQLRSRPPPPEAAAATNASVDGGGSSAVSTPSGGGVLLYHTVMKECLGAVGGNVAAAAAEAKMPPAPPPGARPVLPPVSAATLSDLHAAYSQLFSAGMSRLGKADQEAVRAALEVLMAAQEPLPVSVLAAMGLAGALHLLPGYGILISGPPATIATAATAADGSDGGTCGALAKSSFPLISSSAVASGSSPEGHHTVRIMHRSLVDWLADPRVSGPLLATSAARGHARIARYLLAQVVTTAAASAAPPPPNAAPPVGAAAAAAAAARCRAPSPYALTYLVRHLVAGGDRDALDSLLQQYSFLAAVLSCGGAQALLRDLLALPGPGPLVNDMLRWLPEQAPVLTGTTLTGEDVLGNLLQHCPVGSAAFRSAQERVVAEAAAAGRSGWRLRHGLGLPRMWPALRGVLEGHSRVVMAVAWSPDGRTLASGSGDATIRLWEAASGECIATLAGHSSDVQSVSWSPSGGALASGGNDGSIRLWDMATGDCVAVLLLGQPGEEVRSVAWSFDGRALASGSNLGEVRVWDAASGDCVLALEGHVDAVLSVAWSPRGGVLASCGEDETVRLWHPASGQCTATMLGHAGCVRRVSWSPDGRTLASGSDDTTIRLWDAATGECVSTLEGHSWPVTCVGWSPDGRDLVSGSTDQTIRLWDAASGVCLGGLEEFSYSVSWSPDGRTLASGGSIDPCVRLWDVAATIGAAEEGAGGGAGQQGHSDIVNTVAFSPDGRTLASGSDDKTIRLWDAATGECVSTLEGPLDRVFAVSWSPDGRTLASGSRDMGLRLWNVKTGGCTSVLKGHLDTVYSVDWSPDGTALVSGSGDKTIRVWAAASGACSGTLEGHQDTVWSVAWSPDGTALASGSIDATVRLWDPAVARCTAKLEGHSSEVRSVSWSPDGRTLASGSIDMTIRLWDAATGNCTAVLRGHCGCVFSVAFSPDGRTLASGGRDKSVRLWDVAADGELVSVLQGHPDDVNTVAWSPDGRALASGSDDETIRLYAREGGLRGTA